MQSTHRPQLFVPTGQYIPGAASGVTPVMFLGRQLAWPSGCPLTYALIAPGPQASPQGAAVPFIDLKSDVSDSMDTDIKTHCYLGAKI